MWQLVQVIDCCPFLSSSKTARTHILGYSENLDSDKCVLQTQFSKSFQSSKNNRVLLQSSTSPLDPWKENRFLPWYHNQCKKCERGRLRQERTVTSVPAPSLTCLQPVICKLHYMFQQHHRFHHKIQKLQPCDFLLCACTLPG